MLLKTDFTKYLSTGWLADLKAINVVYLNALCVIACGLSEALMPTVAHNWLALSILCAIFGFTFASAYVLIPKLAELICGVDNFASALGLNFFMQGVGLLVGTPFAGWIFEMTGRYVVQIYSKCSQVFIFCCLLQLATVILGVWWIHRL